MRKLLPIFVLILASFILLSPIHTYASEVASEYQVNDSQAQSGDILTSSPSQGLVRSNVAYDIRVFGVIADEPLAVYLELNPAKNDRPILRNGDAIVNVTDYNGAIEPGDYITTSPVPGKGMKALDSGYVVGVATSTVTPGPKISFQGRQLTTGQVNVAMGIQYYELSGARSALHLLDGINAAFFRSVQNPEQFTNVVRYMVAGFIAIAAFLLGFFTFSRSLSRGIEAMGRNPLAKQSIQASMILQTVLTVVTTFGAIILAYIVIRV